MSRTIVDSPTKTGLGSRVISKACFLGTATVILSPCRRSWWRSWFREEPEIDGEAQCFTMVKALDADLPKDLRGLGKSPTFD